MCELFGTSFSGKCDVKKYLKTFFSHSVYNPHGYGLKIFNRDKNYELKSPIRADDSQELKNFLNTKRTIVLDSVFHIRYMTQGEPKIENCHPFSILDNTGSEWCLAHNGYIKDNEYLYYMRNVQKGETDSERILYYIVRFINHIDGDYESSIRNRIEIKLLEDVITNDISPLGKVNLIIYHNGQTFVFCNRKGTLHFLKKKNGYIFSTTKLTDEDWVEFEVERLYVFKNGEIVY